MGEGEKLNHFASQDAERLKRFEYSNVSLLVSDKDAKQYKDPRSVSDVVTDPDMLSSHCVLTITQCVA